MTTCPYCNTALHIQVKTCAFHDLWDMYTTLGRVLDTLINVARKKGLKIDYDESNTTTTKQP